VAAPLESAEDLAKSENRRILQEIIENAKDQQAVDEANDTLKQLDEPAAESGVRTQRRMRLERSRRERGQPRIVNGRGTHFYPATGALLKGVDKRSAKVACTGTMISCNHFLTAAHCVEPDPRPATYKIYLHSGGIFDVTDVQWPKEHYKFPNADVAVLTLSESVKGIAPERINEGATPLRNTEGSIVGFGRTGGNRDDYGIKREGFVKTDTCGAIYPGVPLVCWKYDAFVQPAQTGSNTCNMDSGGPLYIAEAKGAARFRVIAGITSGGAPDTQCLIDKASYDADVFRYREWIKTQAGLVDEPKACGATALNVSRDVLGQVDFLSPNMNELVYSLPVKAGMTQLMVAMNGEDNDNNSNNFDLYVIRGDNTATQMAMCTEEGSGQVALCEIDNPEPGPWTIVVRRKAGGGFVQIVVTQIPKPTQ
jgi:hypothetical protein